jgi:AbrB family looped-hinge helix DNA binding protein
MAEVRMPTATMTSKGQITIPKEIRESLHLRAGDRVSFVVGEDGAVSIRPSTVDLLALYGVLRPKVRGVTVEQMNETVRRSAARRLK